MSPIAPPECMAAEASGSVLDTEGVDTILKE